MNNNYLQEELIEGIKKNDNKVIDFVYKSAFPLVKHFVTKNSGDVLNAEDIFQESFMVLYQKIQNDFHLTCSVNTYLFNISERLWLKHLRQKKSNKEFFFTDTDFALNADDEDIQKKMEWDMKLDLLDVAIQKLGAPCSSILTAFYVQKKSMMDISKELEYENEDNVRKDKYRCLVRLRKVFLELQ